MKVLLLVLAGCWAALDSSAQLKPATQIKLPADQSNAVSLGASIPVGDFSNTHFLGATAQYEITNHRSGLLNKKPSSLLGWLVQSGAAFYTGRKESISSYSYTYPHYIFLHVYGGAIINPAKEFNINITAGPALGLYNGDSQFNLGIQLEANYYFNRKLGIAPGLHWMKEAGANALVAASLKAVLTF